MYIRAHDPSESIRLILEWLDSWTYSQQDITAEPPGVKTTTERRTKKNAFVIVFAPLEPAVPEILVSALWLSYVRQDSASLPPPPFLSFSFFSMSGVLI